MGMWRNDSLETEISWVREILTECAVDRWRGTETNIWTEIVTAVTTQLAASAGDTWLQRYTIAYQFKRIK